MTNNIRIVTAPDDDPDIAFSAIEAIRPVPYVSSAETETWPDGFKRVSKVTKMRGTGLFICLEPSIRDDGAVDVVLRRMLSWPTVVNSFTRIQQTLFSVAARHSWAEAIVHTELVSAQTSTPSFSGEILVTMVGRKLMGAGL